MSALLSKDLCTSDSLPIVDKKIIEHFESLPDGYWDFVEHTKRHSHNIHAYPAMMIPPIPKNLINIMIKYQPNIKNLLDPFSGAGTVLLEGLLANMNVWGIDLNPLACLIASAKCTPVDPVVLKSTNEALLRKITKDIENNITIKKPDFYNIDFWFKDYVIKDLQIVKQRIKEISDKRIKLLSWVAFSETVRACSNTRNNEFKLYRMSKLRLENFAPSVLDVFRANLDKCEKGMADLYRAYQGGLITEIIAQDTRDFALDQKMDLVVTSPPYGDSRTTVAYGQYSRLSLQWLDLEDYGLVDSKIEKARLDKYLLGGTNGTKENDLPSEFLRSALREIAASDENRALDVLSFYIDLDKCLSNITKHMKVNSYQFWVVGNRTVRKVNIPTNRIISELGSQYNLKTVINGSRNISSKRMPKENSPTNVKGKKVTTMNNENIVVLRKVK